jgi:MFS family permease
LNSPAPNSLARAWVVVALLCVVGCLNYLDRNMMTTMHTSIVAAIPMTEARFGLLLSVFLWTYALLSPFAGFLADRIGRSRVIVGSLLVWSVTTLVTAHARTYGELLATRALMGLSEACYIPAALALISDYHGRETRSLATGIHMAGIMVGAGLGGLGGWLAERHTWNYPFSIFGWIGVFYSIVLLFWLRDPAVPATEPGEVPNERSGAPPRFWTAVRNLLSEPAFLVCLAFFGTLGVMGWGLIGWLPTYFQEQFHLGQTAAGFSATGYLNAASFGGVLLGGFLADRAARRNPRGRIWVPMVGLVIAAGGVLLLSQAQVIGLAIAGLVIYGLTRTFSDTNMMPILCLVADRRYRGTGYGFLNLVSCTVGGFGNLAGGLLRDAHIDLSKMFLAMVGVLLFCAFLLSRLKPRTIPFSP